MFDLVPFARPRREVADGNGEPGLIGERLQFQFPWAETRPAAAAAAGSDREPLGLRVDLFAHRMPPSPDGFNRERCRVMVDADTHPSSVLRQVIDAVRRSTSKFPESRNHAHGRFPVFLAVSSPGRCS